MLQSIWDLYSPFIGLWAFISGVVMIVTGLLSTFSFSAREEDDAYKTFFTAFFFSLLSLLGSFIYPLVAVTLLFCLGRVLWRDGPTHEVLLSIFKTMGFDGERRARRRKKRRKRKEERALHLRGLQREISLLEGQVKALQAEVHRDQEDLLQDVLPGERHEVLRERAV